MKILHEINQLEKGGAERVVAGIIAHDKENEHTVYTYKDGPMRRILEAAGARVIIEDPKNSVDLDVDLIHLHTGGQESTLASAVRGVYPTVETVHSPVVSAVREEFVHQRVGVSDLVSKMNRKCVTIYNGVDMSRVSLVLDHERREAKRKLAIDHDAFVVGRLGRIGKDKCLEEFLAACHFAQASDSASERVRNMHVVIVGDEAKDSRGHLGRMKVAAASFPLRNVHWLPATEEIKQALAAMDVFMYPSPTEGFGLVFLEAMACGLPVLTWETPLTREILQGHAYLVPEGVAPLGEALEVLANRPDVRASIGTAGRTHAVNFSEPKMAAEYRRLYRQVFDRVGEKEPCVTTPNLR